MALNLRLPLNYQWGDSSEVRVGFFAFDSRGEGRLAVASLSGTNITAAAVEDGSVMYLASSPSTHYQRLLDPLDFVDIGDFVTAEAGSLVGRSLCFFILDLAQHSDDPIVQRFVNSLLGPLAVNAFSTNDAGT